MNYGFQHENNVYGPDGLIGIKPEDTEAYNKAVEAKEIAWLKTAPEKVFLYVRMPASYAAMPGSIGFGVNNQKAPMCFSTANHFDLAINTWLGTKVSEYVSIGPRVRSGFGLDTYRRPVSARIFGVLYHGWYMESSGDYCRLKKAKRQ